ncbi:MAG: DUF1003 domain-containing protein [bacterium]
MSQEIYHTPKINITPENSFRGDEIRPAIYDLIKKDKPEITKNSIISIEELNKYRMLHLSMIVQQEKGDADKLDKEVVESIANNKILSENIEDTVDDNLTTGQKVADEVARFGGSWKFIILFFSFIMVWMIINLWFIMSKPFDPYPFILLNLVLSCLAAIQAPIIMMSQNRQEEKDRIRNEHDYKVNLKAELEIKILNEKIDHMIVNHNRRLFETQEILTEILDDMMNDVHSLMKNKND